MHFAKPQLFHLLWLVLAMIGLYVWYFRWRKRALARLGEMELMQRLTASVSPSGQRWKAAMLIVAASLIAVALARPQLGTKEDVVRRRGIDLVVVLDTSLSMMAEDIKPNRLERAKHAVEELIVNLRGDRVGIVPFAGDSFVQCPLTLDYGAARLLLSAVGPDSIPVPGTDIAKALRRALSLFNREERKFKAVILLTDGGEETEDVIKSAKEAKKEGVRVFPIGIGSRSGEPIPTKDAHGKPAGYKTNRQGQVVLTRLNSQVLQEVARLTEGAYYAFQGGTLELDGVLDQINHLEKKDLASRVYDLYEDRFVYFIIVALALIVAELFVAERKRVTGPPGYLAS